MIYNPGRVAQRAWGRQLSPPYPGNNSHTDKHTQSSTSYDTNANSDKGNQPQSESLIGFTVMAYCQQHHLPALTVPQIKQLTRALARQRQHACVIVMGRTLGAQSHHGDKNQWRWRVWVMCWHSPIVWGWTEQCGVGGMHCLLSPDLGAIPTESQNTQSKKIIS